MFWQLTIDANDPPRLARFWAQALGWSGSPPAGDEPWQAHYRARLGERAAFEERLFDPSGRPPAVWFQQVPEGKAGKNRLHLDLYPTGRDGRLSFAERVRLVEETVDRLTALGATVDHRVRHEDPDDAEYYVVMHDPEGNEFCVS